MKNIKQTTYSFLVFSLFFVLICLFFGIPNKKSIYGYQTTPNSDLGVCVAGGRTVAACQAAGYICEPYSICGNCGGNVTTYQTNEIPISPWYGPYDSTDFCIDGWSWYYRYITADYYVLGNELGGASCINNGLQAFCNFTDGINCTVLKIDGLRTTHYKCIAPDQTADVLTLSIYPSIRSIEKGNSTTYTLTINNSYSGTMNLSVTGCPSGASCSLNTSSLSFSSDSSDNTNNSVVLTVSNTSNVSVGSYTVGVSGTINSNSASASAGLIITSPATVPASVSITANQTLIPYNTATNLNWSYSNASSCSITSPGSISSYPSGSGSVSTGNLTVSRTYTIACDGVSSSVTINVNTPVDYALNLIKTGQGTIVSSPAGINCGNSCSTQSYTFVEGTAVTLTATPAASRIFTGWGGACSGKGTCSVSMDSSKTVYANFIVDPDYKEF